MGLTDKQRAAVFARDKGICAFSGLSLWLLDFGAAPQGQPDWADHIRPVSRGGKDTIDNLVCASFFYNRKKLNNASDSVYLFSEGRPTENFLWVHGGLGQEQADLLRRHRAINDTDWYFNRAIFNLRVAMHDEWEGFLAKRTAEYWQRSAFRRLETWRKLSGCSDGQTFVKRGLVRYPAAPDVKLMLSLAEATSIATIEKIYRRLFRHYRANADALDKFAHTSNLALRKKILRRARDKTATTEPLLNALQTHVASHSIAV